MMNDSLSTESLSQLVDISKQNHVNVIILVSKNLKLLYKKKVILC
jgi:hypothetical protein